MRLRWKPACVVVIVALTLAASACGGSGAKSSYEPSVYAGFRGRTLGVASLDSVPALELRYLLHKAGLNADTKDGDVTFLEAPGDSLPGLLDRNEAQAIVLPPQTAFGLLTETRYSTQAHVAKDYAAASGRRALSTVLLTYPDLTYQRPSELGEVVTMLKQSTAYFKSNRHDVLASVIKKQGLDKAFVEWQDKRQRATFGDASEGMQKGVLGLWQAAFELGDIKQAPTIADTLFVAPPRSTATGRATISLAVLDDATRRGALYAIEQGLVRSKHVDLDITYLPPSGLAEAADAREYDVVEGSPLMLPNAQDQLLDFVLLCGGIEDVDSTLLFGRAAASR